MQETILATLHQHRMPTMRRCYALSRNMRSRPSLGPRHAARLIGSVRTFAGWTNLASGAQQ